MAGGTAKVQFLAGVTFKEHLHLLLPTQHVSCGYRKLFTGKIGVGSVTPSISYGFISIPSSCLHGVIC